MRNPQRCDGGRCAGENGDIVQRARPLLGTLVALRVEGLGAARAQRALELAFAEVASIHRLMSFHQSGSDLDRLHRARSGACVRVDARTRHVLAFALRFAAESAGRFDPTVAAQQVAWGCLPHPAGSQPPHPRATWRDIELEGPRAVRLRRPLWIDLGGIAKGYAVDRAVEILLAAGAVQACANAGGDLRIAGPRAERVYLHPARRAPPVELGDAAIATSVRAPAHGARGSSGATHVDGATRRPSGRAGDAVSIVAPTCIVADALTKIVLAQRDALTQRVLAAHAAQACVRGRGLPQWFPAAA